MAQSFPKLCMQLTNCIESELCYKGRREVGGGEGGFGGREGECDCEWRHFGCMLWMVGGRVALERVGVIVSGNILLSRYSHFFRQFFCAQKLYAVCFGWRDGVIVSGNQ